MQLVQSMRDRLTLKTFPDGKLDSSCHRLEIRDSPRHLLIEARQGSFQSRTVFQSDRSPIVGGVAVPYESLIAHQGQRELFTRGAFVGVLQNEKHDVRLYTDHRYTVDSLMASRKSGSLALVDTDRGLEFEARLPDTERSKHLVELAEQGAVGASVGFPVTTSKFSMVDGVRHWQDVDLAEISIVTDPAYADATVEKRQEDILDDWITLFQIRQIFAKRR